jgi:hypothetical protein
MLLTGRAVSPALPRAAVAMSSLYFGGAGEDVSCKLVEFDVAML